MGRSVAPTFLSLAGAELAQGGRRSKDSVPKDDYAWDWKRTEEKMQGRSLQLRRGQGERVMALEFW